MNTGNNTNFVLGSVFFLFQISLNHKPFANHFVRDSLLDFYQDLYIEASRKAIQSSIVLIRHSVEELGYFNPGLEKEKLNFILKSSIREICSNLFSKSIYFEAGKYSINTLVPADVPECGTHAEILSRLDDVTFQILGPDNTMSSITQPQVAIVMYSHA
jgi:hypothetical protein